jgi:hypothetical protein
MRQNQYWPYLLAALADPLHITPGSRCLLLRFSLLHRVTFVIVAKAIICPQSNVTVPCDRSLF